MTASALRELPGEYEIIPQRFRYRPFAELLRAGWYDEEDPELDVLNLTRHLCLQDFAIGDGTDAKLCMVLVGLTEEMGEAGGLYEISKRLRVPGLRGATFAELLALGASHMGLQRAHRISLLHAIELKRGPRAPYLDAEGGKRRLNSRHSDPHCAWGKSWRFACVRMVSTRP